MKFIFDLDGTITAKETLPLIADYFNIEDEINQLTTKTLAGDIPFIESFIKRVHILGKLPVSEINNLLASVELLEDVVSFIQENHNDCIITTGNFNGWIESLAQRIGCEYFSSDGIVKDDKIVKLTHILKKETVVQKFKLEGEKVIFIGDSNNDVEAMREADISIACGIVHNPAKAVFSIADYLIYSEKSLCRLLNQIKQEQSGKSIVLSCAGIGSRLGLGQTKALIKFNTKPLIHYLLDSFLTIEDVRIVIGFQADEVVKVVLQKNSDVIFVYNHDYFYTKTGTSYYLGAKHANEYVIAWDGDLLVHPDDVQKCLDFDGEFVGCSQTITDDAVLVQLNDRNEVISFSREKGEYEWSGPASLKKEHIKYVSGHVYTQIEEYLPMSSLIIRAQDIDTYEDYKRAEKFMESWSKGNNKIDDYYSNMAKKITKPEETRNKAKDFSKYDISFMKQFAGKEKNLLDLGSGTGLLINNLKQDFKTITAVEKYPNFSKFIDKSQNITVINDDLLDLKIDKTFDVISIFGVMNFFSYLEAKKIYTNIKLFLNDDSIFIIKHQMGVSEDVVVDGYSEELKTNYYSEYRYVKKEIELLEEIGFDVIEKVDIYPDEYNRWNNTHFYALVCKKQK